MSLAKDHDPYQMRSFAIVTWRSVAHNLQESRLELGLRLSDWIPTGERSGLQMRIATTESVSLCEPMKSLSAFLELEATIRAGGAIVLDEQPTFPQTPPR